MTSEALTALRAEFDRLEGELRRALTPTERTEVKQAIVALFRRTETAISELAAFKETIRELVSGFKALPADVVASVRHDHIGASTFIERGWSELAAGQWHAAETMLRQAMALDATSGLAQALLGWALFQQRREDEALQLCQQVLQREPEHGVARVVVGACCLRKGIVGEAIEHLTRAAARTGDARATLYAHFWLGVAYLQRDMWSDAVEFLRRAVTLGPNLAEGWAELGRALWGLGRHEEAREAWLVGSRIRHSPYAGRCTELLEMVQAGGTPPRSPFS